MATDAILSFVVETIGKLLIEEAKSLCGVEDKLKELKSTVQTIRALLKDAEANRHEKEAVRVWTAQIRDAAYDAEDVLETYVLMVELKRQGGVKGALKRFAGLPDEALTLHKIGQDVDKINSRLSKIAADSRALGIQKAMVVEESHSSQARLWEQRQSFPHVVDHNLVGMESRTEELVKYLVDEKNQFQVLSIWGMGGLGKTTLARKVYQHGKVENNFERFAWAYVSQQCQSRVTWEGIFKSLISKSTEHAERVAEIVAKMQEQELVGGLYDVLSKEKCLVVHDDIWTPDTWNKLKVAFPHETRSRIVLTSREKNIVSHAERKVFFCQPQFLNEKESWELLQKIVFPIRNEDSDFKNKERMEELGKRMEGRLL